jgi:hypothetical protein
MVDEILKEKLVCPFVTGNVLGSTCSQNKIEQIKNLKPK